MSGYRTATTSFQAGTGSGIAVVSGVLVVNVTPVSTTDANEDDLMTYSLPGGTLSANGKALRIRAQFTSSANATNHIFHLYFGATKIATTVSNDATASVGAYMDAIVARTGPTAQISSSFSQKGLSLAAATLLSNGFATPAETLSGAVIIKGTAQNANPGTITQTLLMVEVLN